MPTVRVISALGCRSRRAPSRVDAPHADTDGRIRWSRDYATTRVPAGDVIQKDQALSAGGS